MVCLPPNCLSIPRRLTRGLISREDLCGSKPPHLHPLTHKHTTLAPAPFRLYKATIVQHNGGHPLLRFPLYPLVWFTHNSAPFSLWPVSLVVFISQFFGGFFFFFYHFIMSVLASLLLYQLRHQLTVRFKIETVSKWTPNMCTTPNMQHDKLLKLRQKKNKT